MINRSNWLLVKSYLDYLSTVQQVSQKTLEAESSRLRVLLVWAGDVGFGVGNAVTLIRPGFPYYAVNFRLDGKEGNHSPAYSQKLISSARRFFTWLTVHHRGFSVLVPWLHSLVLPRLLVKPVKARDVVTVDYVRSLAQLEVSTIRYQRIVAAAVFLFLSGMRVDAFVSMPVNVFDLSSLSVYQWPSLGVRTKFGKHATTYLLNLPDLLEVVTAWHQKVSDFAFWFAPLTRDGDLLQEETFQPGRFRAAALREDLRELCHVSGLRYYAPHAFRHGHAVYSFEVAKDVGDWKAISQNLMHSSLTVTDGIYGVLHDRDTQLRISRLGQQNQSVDLQAMLEDLLKQLKQK